MNHRTEEAGPIRKAGALIGGMAIIVGLLCLFILPVVLQWAGAGETVVTIGAVVAIAVVLLAIFKG